MPKFPEGWQNIREDRLCVRYKNILDGREVIKGKRIGKDCPLTRDEILEYRKRGVIFCVKMIKDRLETHSIREALDLLNKARGGPPTIRTFNDEDEDEI